MTRASGDGSPIAVVGVARRLPDDGGASPGASPEKTPAARAEHLALELAWEALEDAGVGAAASASAIGTFVSSPLRSSVGAIADRISFVHRLSGPSVTLDAPGAPSLLAVHFACESLREGVSEIALAGVVGLDPGNDDAAGGAESAGGAAIALKPLRSARADGDRVLCALGTTAVDDEGAWSPPSEGVNGFSGLVDAALSGGQRQGTAHSRGADGSSCHVVLVEEPPAARGEAASPCPGLAQDLLPLLPAAMPLVLSANSEPALRRSAQRLERHLLDRPDLSAADVSYSLLASRSTLSHCAIEVVANREQLTESIASLAAGRSSAVSARGVRRNELQPAMVFPGQGGQWAGMARGLLEASPAFAAHIDACEQALEPFVTWSLRELVRDEEGEWLQRLDLLQPVLLMVTIALGKLWRDCGVEPSAVMGQSQGEIAAAHIAGGLSLDDAARLGALHSRASLSLVGKGGMAAVAMPASEVRDLLGEIAGEATIAGLNGPASTVISGVEEALERLLAECRSRGVSAQRVTVDYAAHSTQIESLREEMLAAFAPVSPGASELPFYSTLTGGRLDTRELGAEHWYRCLREPVRLEQTVRRVLEDGPRPLIEVGPHPVLALGLEQTVEAALDDGDERAPVLGTLRRGEGGRERFALSLAEAHCAGAAVSWDAVLDGAGKVELPARPFAQEHSELDREQELLELVRSEVAAILGHGQGRELPTGVSFRELGVESAAAIELRNRLRASTGLALATTVIYDHPTVDGLTAHLQRVAGSRGGEGAAGVLSRRGSEEPVAVVGMACRLPGASSPRQLWQLLASGGDATSEFPDDRGWDRERLYDSDPDRPNTAYARRGGFLADAGDFDAEFFDISPREALAMDPQQRLLLETSWEALEEAGIDPGELRGTASGVFAGISSQDYTAGLRETGDSVEGYRLTGSATSVVSGRVSYFLGLEGPAITVDTACSSSLVATHLAAAALRGGECDLALAGGVTVLASPGLFTDLSRQRVLSPDGRCKSFAEAADGAGFSDGAGILVLERLADAEASGHRVLATIKGSAVNQDGASNGLTAPNGPAQERVIRQALANAGLEPADVDMVEAHGTGTALGDPIEAGALLATYGQDREQPVRLGSLKSNIGHAQAAAGVGGVIKAVMAMREATMPKTLHVDRPSSRVDWEAGKMELLADSLPWTAIERPRRAAVSSFGVSGTNAHLILEEAPAAQPASDEEKGGASGDRPLGGTVPLLLSAKSEPALVEQAGRLASRLRADPDLDLADAAYTLATARPSLEHRAVVLAPSREGALAALDSLAVGEPDPSLLVRGASREAAKAAFLFSGHGSQWQGMALELIESSSAFAASTQECEAALAPHLDFSLRDVLTGAEGAASLQRLEVVGPALFAVMVSLARLWQACGLEPAAVAGHSQGEIVAAHIAGGLSLEDAARLTAVRSRLISTLAGEGGLVSLIAPRARVEALIESWPGSIEPAAYNGPASTIVSGTREALDQLLAVCEQDGVRARELPASIPSHSRHVEQLREQVLEACADLSPRSGSIPFHSTVTGGLLDTARLDAEYWYRNLRQPVLFEQVARGLVEAGHRALIEISPHPISAVAVQETIEQAGADLGEATVIETLRRKQGAQRFALSLASAHTAGVPIEWERFFAGSGAKAVSLPTYPFQRRRYWLAPASAGSDPTALGQEAVAHPFLAAAIEDPEGEGIAFSGRISLSEHPWLADHAAFGTAILPATAFLETALFAGKRAGAPTLVELALEAPLILPGQGAVALRVKVSGAGEEGEREIRIHSRPEREEEGGWIRNASGTLSPRSQSAPEPLAQWPPAGEPVDLDRLRLDLAEAGFEYGEAFGGLQAAWRVGEELYAEVSLPEQLHRGSFAIHPALLDAALHPVALKLGEGVSLPFSWSGAWLSGTSSAQLRARLIGRGDGGVSLEAFDGEGTPLGRIEGLRSRPLEPGQLRGGAMPPLHELRWEPLASTSAAADSELWSAPRAGVGAEAAREASIATLEKLQAFLVRAEREDSRLAILTEGALAARPGEAPDLATAALAGLVRSAASEHPGRFCLIDSDGSEASAAALEDALAADPGETQIALREGEALVPRLVQSKGGAKEPTSLDPERTVLITGATGGLGALVARHLVEAHGARHLLLVSRSGEDAPGATELRAALEQLGASARIAVCDVSEREQLRALLDSIPQAHPLGALVHCAVVLDDATVRTASPAQLQRVFAAKADAAWHLHELTRELDLSHFVCFSSIAGLLGASGQGAYAAANSFLDALAARRRAEGLAGSSIAWGLWRRESATTDHLGEADLARLRRMGVHALTDEQGLALFDAALSGDLSLAVAARFDRPALRAQASAGALPKLLAELAPSATLSSAPDGALLRRLREAPEATRERLAEDFVRAEVAAILGYPSAKAVGPDDAFKDLGFDSLAAVELRNRLGTAVGSRLSASLAFDYPTAAAVAMHLLEKAELSGAAQPADSAAAPEPSPVAARLEQASDKELLDFIDAQVGSKRG